MICDGSINLIFNTAILVSPETLVCLLDEILEFFSCFVLLHVFLIIVKLLVYIICCYCLAKK
jgi:hypothetical protein